MYRFQTLGEFRALLTLYNIGIEEVRGERGGKSYRGLLYTALDADGKQAEATPLKSSLFSKSVGFNVLEKQMERSGAKIEKNKNKEHLRHRVAEAFLDAPTEKQLRENLRTFHVDLYLRRNDTGRITGVTFIDHEKRCVLNGSRLGKEYSANALNERYPEAMQKSGADLHTLSGEADRRQISTVNKQKKRPKGRSI
jgi:hypothetical protein